MAGRDDLIRIGADHDPQVLGGEVSRIDFDTAEGAFSIVVESLPTAGRIIAELVALNSAPPHERTRIGDWPIP